jgi:predicted AAA+ superfamily ATPase
MKENISNGEIKYISRRIAKKIRDIVNKFPIAVITGARQVGKSTMLRHEFNDFTYITMDDYAVREQARFDPQSLWIGKDKVIIDEAQKFPHIFEAIKLTVDSSNRSRRFILSGSSNLLLMKQVTESLAGRAIYFELLPITFGEINEALEPANYFNLWDEKYLQAEAALEKVDPLMFLMRGFMPPLLNAEDHTDVLYWMDGYVRTYLERDLREMSQVDSIIDFRNVMQSLAFRTGNVLNQADVARDTNISASTVFRYIKLLEISNIVQRIHVYSKNRRKRIIKSPKLFFIDPALNIFLSGYHDAETLQKSREFGNYFESMVYLHLRALCELMVPKAGLYYWRTVNRQEIDFVIEHARKLLAIEVKYTANPSAYDIKNLLLFMEDYPETVRGILIHTGTDIRWLHSRIIAVPWWWIDM